MPSSGGSKTQKQTTTNEPWKPSQPGLIESIGDVRDLYKSGGLEIDYPSFPTVAPVAPETEQAWGGIYQRATQGNPLLGQSQGYVSDVLSGKYLNADAPGFSEVLAKTRDMVNANKSLTGRYGSEAHDAAVARELGGLQYQNYARERGIQDQAAALAPSLAREDYYDLDRLGQVGTQRQGQMQAQIDDEVERQQWEQQKAANAIALYQQLLAGNMGGTTTAKVPMQGGGTNPLLSVLGIGAQLGGAYLGNPGIF
jgi:hypothetical protein